MDIDLTNYTDLFTNKFKDIIFDEERYLVLYGGAGSSKSYSAALKVIYDVINGMRYLVVRKVYRTLTESCYKLIKTIISNLKLDKLFIYTKSPLKISSITGGEIIFAGLDDSEKIKSIADIDRIWIEEATELTQNDLEQLDLRLRGKENHQIILTFNPCPSFLKDFFFEKTKPNTKIIHSTYLDNNFLDKSYKDKMSNLQGNIRTIYGQGQWGLTEGLIFNYELIESFPDDGKYIYGLDFGYNDETAIVKAVIIDKQIYLEECYYKNKVTAEDLIKDFDFGKTLIYGDNSRPEMIESLRRKGINILPCRKGKDSILTSIQFLNSFGKLNITNNSINLIKELTLYVWKKDKEGKSLEVPDSCQDHCIDAGRYAIYSHYFKEKQYPTRQMLGI